jgi:hypothetical protein
VLATLLAAPGAAILALDGWKYLEVIALKLPLSAKVSHPVLLPRMWLNRTPDGQGFFR